MRYRSKRKYYYRQIPQPTGQEWIVIDDIRLWLPLEKRGAFNLPSSFNREIVLSGPGWLIARSALNCLLQLTIGDRQQYHIEWVQKIGDGLSNEVYRADVIFPRQEEHIVFAVSLLSDTADTDAGFRMIKEFRLLDSIRQETTSFIVPEPVGIIWYDGSLISVREFIFGSPIELRAPKSHIAQPWEIVAKVAAEIHWLPTVQLPNDLRRYPNRQEQAVSRVIKYESFDIPEIQNTLQWISENLPPQEESVLVHSDLLGQNIYRTAAEEIYVLDWEYAFVGDPAYDLAIVTGGVKNPFQVPGGLDRLIESYLSARGKEITRKDVHVYELLLCLGWYKQSLDRSEGGHGPEYYLNQLSNMLKRVEK